MGFGAMDNQEGGHSTQCTSETHLVVIQRPILLVDLHSHAPAREDEWASNKEIDN
jgi:hypothetical protein